MKPHPSNSTIRRALAGVLAIAGVAAAQEREGARAIPSVSTQSLAATTSADKARRPASLKEVLRLASRNSFDLQSARAQAAQVKAQTSRVWSAILPDMNVSGSLVRTSAPALLDLGTFVGLVSGVFQIPPVNQSAIPEPVTIVGRNSAYGTLQISQVLLTPGMLLLPAAFEARDAAEFGAREAQEQVLLNVARLYLGIAGLEKLEAAARDAEVVALRREQDAKAQLAAGIAIEVAVLRAQSETAQARSTAWSLHGQRQALLALLESMVGDAVNPTADAVDISFAAATAEAQSPWENTFAVQAAAQNVKVQERFATYDQFAWAPTLSAAFRGNYNSNSGFAGVNLSYDLMLQLNIPLYDRGVRYAALREDKAKLADAKAKLDGARARAKATWIGAKANMEAAEAAYEQASTQFQLAQRAQKQVEAAVQAGMATALEQSDLDNKRFFAASNQANALAQLNIRRVEVAAAEGHLAKLADVSQNQP